MHELQENKQKQYDAFLNCFIKYPQIQSIYDCFDRLRYYQRRHASLSSVQESDVPCMLLTGDTGSGKSALIKHYRETAQRLVPTSSQNKPVLVVRIPEIPELDKLLSHMLAELDHFGAGYRLGRSKDNELTESLFKVLRYRNTELIIINEVQELIEHKSPKECSAISNRLKYISEKSGVPLVFVGMPWADKLTRDPQWRSRIRYFQFLPYFKVSEPEQREHFSKLINGFCNRMGFKEPPTLNTLHPLKALFSACSGEMRSLKYLLNDALHIALSQGSEELTMTHLAEAFKLSGTRSENPFLMCADDIKLKEVSEYSRFNESTSRADERIVSPVFADVLSVAQVFKKNK
jgi:Cdc6-like AAA superfamily ATPase